MNRELRVDKKCQVSRAIFFFLSFLESFFSSKNTRFCVPGKKAKRRPALHIVAASSPSDEKKKKRKKAELNRGSVSFSSLENKQRFVLLSFCFLPLSHLSLSRCLSLSLSFSPPPPHSLRMKSLVLDNDGKNCLLREQRNLPPEEFLCTVRTEPPARRKRGGRRRRRFRPPQLPVPPSCSLPRLSPPPPPPPRPAASCRPSTLRRTRT